MEILYVKSTISDVNRLMASVFDTKVIGLACFQVFDKIIQNEAAAYEGTEIAVLEESGSFFSYHPQMAIKNELTVGFEMNRGERFSIISPAGVHMFLLLNNCRS